MIKEPLLSWITIPEFAHRQPLDVYHKENQGQQAEPERIQNLHVLARAEYYCKDVREQQMMRITADDYYKLYINGVFAAQGPAPAYPEHYYYNVIDLAPYLKKGNNILAVHLYYQGLVNRVWNSGDGRFGMACDILDSSGGGQAPEWKYCISEAYSGKITGYQTQFTEDFDSNRWEENWNTGEYDDSSWKTMVPAGWADYVMTEQPTKMLAISALQPAKVQKSKGRWMLDFGKEITGSLSVRAEGRKGSRVILRYGEELEEDGNVRFDMRCNCCYEENWLLAEGESRYQPYDYKGFRYAELHFGEETEILEVTAIVRHYPMEDGSCGLKSSNAHLDEIFAVCKNGVKCGTQEGYLDCPTREKGQYLGDSIVTAHSQVWLTGTLEMERKCIAQFAQTAAICPGLMGVAPGSFMQEIADFSLLWSRLLLLDYRFSGEKEMLEKYYPAAKGILEHFKSYERADGLLDQVADKWNLVDWPENLRDNYDFVLSRPVVAPGCHNVINALYIGAFKTLAEIENILGIPETGNWETRKEAYIRAFYRQEQGVFADSETSNHAALHSNVYALYFGLCPGGREQQIADFMLEKGFACGVFLSYFYLKALAGAGRYRDVWRMLLNESERGWVNMLREGATACFEAWGKGQKWNTSLCHPWASAPVPVLIEDIAGFIPDPEAEEGFRFEPHLPEEVEKFALKLSFRGKEYLIEKKENKVLLNSGEKT